MDSKYFCARLVNVGELDDNEGERKQVGEEAGQVGVGG